ncbi:threonylcarbamoyladenosine tRNA methylthiotransferase MtaB [bacterium BMS3Abin01]|nr:threonylcarbamoyladenosine tRNA methylthiotransferase MtaB [bacterium BMS3Abin01]
MPEKSDNVLHIHTLGCKVNFADVQTVRARLRLDGAGPVALVGTCCVTAEGEKQSRKEVRRSLRRVGGDGNVFVTGCAARLNPEQFSVLGGNVTVLTGEPEDVARTINEVAGGGRRRERDPGAAAARQRTRVFIKVQDGCANRCAYCVIPQVRGLPRSRRAEQVLAEAAARVEEGYGELVISGINVGAYREGGRGLPALLERTAALGGLKRLRLSSIETLHVNEELLMVMAACPVFGSHLHIPLQSGADGVLAAMGRRYDTSLYAERLNLARSLLPAVNITTDVMVGFPGESDAAFADTMSFVAEMGFSKIHVFPYSPRPGTAAAEMDGAVPAPVKKERGRRLRELSDRLGHVFRQRKRGLVDEILLEAAVEPGVYAGYSSDYTRYMVAGGSPGKTVRVFGERVTGGAVWGKVAANE